MKIVATLGPATDGEGLLEKLLAAGVDVARLNFSHGTYAQHAERFQRIRAAARTLGRPIGVMQDLQGPKIRIGRLAGGGPVELVVGRELRITTRDVEGTADVVSTTYGALPRDCRPGDTILMDDGKIRLSVIETGPGEVRTVVVAGGALGEHKGINLPGVAVSAPALTEKDREDLELGLVLGVDFVALSFVRQPSDLELARSLIRRAAHPPGLIAKLEKPEAIEHLDAILAASDGVMVARGDLGVEMAPEEVPPVQKTIIRRANRRGIPVITATQMLESMIVEQIPTRAEASDVANSVWDGTDAVMLSAESAVGAHPIEAVEMMRRIVARAEASTPLTDRRPDRHNMSHAHAISRAACTLAEDLDVKAIIAFTRSGRTADLLSQDRPRVPIFCFTPDESVVRRLTLRWGVRPICGAAASDSDPLLDEMERDLLSLGAVASGDLVVVVGAVPFRQGSHTNFVKLHTVGRG